LAGAYRHKAVPDEPDEPDVTLLIPDGRPTLDRPRCERGRRKQGNDHNRSG
jgi:hypothetical protein